jgi:hypothetical protein
MAETVMKNKNCGSFSTVPAVEYAKTRISPSDLTFGWSNCKRCFWMKHVYGVSHQGPFPGIVMSLSSRQERWYKEKHSRDFSSSLPSGVVHSTGKMLESKPIMVNGQESPFTLGGKYDFLLSYDNGRYGVIDTKVVSKGGKAEFYWPQLAAYDYILSNPKTGEPRACETLGLLVWEIADASQNSADSYNVGFNAEYEPVEVNPAKFQQFIDEVVSLLVGEMPTADESCSNCSYFQKRSDFKI